MPSARRSFLVAPFPSISAEFAVAGALVKIVLPLVGALALAGCAALFPGKPPATFDLSAPSHITAHRGALHGVLVVAQPTAIQTLASQRIVARSAGGQLAYVPAAQWSDQLPDLVQARIVEAFENAGQMRAVGRPSDRLAADYDLISDIRNFGINAAGAPAAEVEIAVRIVSDRGGRVIAGKVFSARVPVRAVTGADAAAGLQQALGTVLDDMVRWTAAHI
jgi:cholesterol transport system auxiliary component